MPSPSASSRDPSQRHETREERQGSGRLGNANRKVVQPPCRNRHRASLDSVEMSGRHDLSVFGEPPADHSARGRTDRATMVVPHRDRRRTAFSAQRRRRQQQVEGIGARVESPAKDAARSRPDSAATSVSYGNRDGGAVGSVHRVGRARLAVAVRTPTDHHPTLCLHCAAVGSSCRYGEGGAVHSVQLRRRGGLSGAIGSPTDHRSVVLFHGAAMAMPGGDHDSAAVRSVDGRRRRGPTILVASPADHGATSGQDRAAMGFPSRNPGGPSRDPCSGIRRRGLPEPIVSPAYDVQGACLHGTAVPPAGGDGDRIARRAIHGGGRSRQVIAVSPADHDIRSALDRAVAGDERCRAIDPVDGGWWRRLPCVVLAPADDER